MSSSHLNQTCFIISVIKADRSYFQHRIATRISPTNSKESPEGIQYLQFRHVLEKQVPCRVLAIHYQLSSYINCFSLHSAQTVIVLLPSACAVQYCLQVTCFLWKRKPKSPAARLPCVSGTGHGGGGGGGDGGRGGGISCAQTEAMIWGKGMNIGSELYHSWVFLIGVWHPISDQKMSFSTLFFRPTLLAEVSLLHGFHRLRSRSRRLSVS